MPVLWLLVVCTCASGGVGLDKSVESVGFTNLGALPDERGEDKVSVGILEIIHTTPGFVVVFKPADQDPQHL